MSAAAKGAPARFPAADQRRRSMIAKVHIAKAQLRMADDDYRAVMLRVAGHDSASFCTEAQLADLLKEFERLGFRARSKSGAPRAADTPTARKARALWISLHHLGAIDNVSEKALEAFATRQLKCEKLQWADESLAYRLIEALKKMAEREGWSHDLAGVQPQARLIVLKRRLVDAIVDKLKAVDLIPAEMGATAAAWKLGGIKMDSIMFATVEQLDLVAKTLGAKLRAHRADGGAR